VESAGRHFDCRGADKADIRAAMLRRVPFGLLALLLLVSTEYGAQIFPPLWGILAVLPPAAGILAVVLLFRRRQDG